MYIIMYMIVYFTMCTHFDQVVNITAQMKQVTSKYKFVIQVNQSINQSINQSVTCVTAPLFVVKAASRRRRDESRNQPKAAENR